jgi:hypothetical protein
MVGTLRFAHPTHRENAPCFASRASEISRPGRDKTTRRANHFRLSEMEVKPRNQKYFA